MGKRSELDWSGMPGDNRYAALSMPTVGKPYQPQPPAVVLHIYDMDKAVLPWWSHRLVTQWTNVSQISYNFQMNIAPLLHSHQQSNNGRFWLTIIYLSWSIKKAQYYDPTTR